MASSFVAGCVIVENDKSLFFHEESGALKTDKKVRNEHNLQLPWRPFLIFTSTSGVWVSRKFGKLSLHPTREIRVTPRISRYQTSRQLTAKLKIAKKQNTFHIFIHYLYPHRTWKALGVFVSNRKVTKLCFTMKLANVNWCETAWTNPKSA